MTPDPTRNPLLPLDPIISDHLDHRLNEAVTNLQRLITDAFNTGVRPLQQEIMDLQAQFRSNGLTQSGPTGYKANLPTPYDGSRQNGEGFIKACCLYLQLNTGCFPDDAAAIRWTLSYMTTGQAQVWRDAAIDHYTNHQKYPWADMKAFVAAFNMEFLPIAEAEEAMVKLAGRTYFQKANESADTYIDGFRDLVKKASLTDVTSIVIKFRRGLQDSLA